jgi:hypothetical protein
MARGFESKDVEFQQAESQRPRSTRRTLSADEREAEAKRHTLELTLSNVRAERHAATNPHHRQMLDRAIQALEDDLREQS